MTKTNNTTEDRAGDGIEERAKAYFNNFHIVQKMDSAEVAEITAIGSRFVTAETATLTTQLNEMREALRAIEAKALCFPDSYNKVYRSNWWHLNTKARCGKSPRRHY